MRRAALIVALAALATATVALASPDPRSLVLKLNDLPAGFSIDRKETESRSNATVARETSATMTKLTRWGRITGFQATFTREPTLRGLLAGALEVQSLASIYRTRHGAAASFVETRRACLKPPFKQLSVGRRLGHEAAYCVATRKSGNTKVTVYVLAWRRNNVTAGVLLAGLAGVVDSTEAVRLARKQDARIAATLK